MAVIDQAPVTVKVPPRIPRPLTKGEKRKLREQMGGDASPDLLQSLERAFSKR